MKQSDDSPLRPGDRVRLLRLPTGKESSQLPLTVGHIYIVRYLDGNNVSTSTDHPGLDGHYHRDRVEKV
jgi:hypothetical protein